MSKASSKLVKACTLSLALLGTTAIAATVALPDLAYAKSENAGGKGNAGGNGGGKGNAGGHGAGNGGEKGAKASKGHSSTRTKSSNGSRSKTRSAGKPKLIEAWFGKRKSSTRIETTRTRVKRTASPTTKRVARVTPNRTATKQAVASAPRPRIKPQGNKMAALLGVHPSELGALNAANASPTALANASPNSRVGLIAQYRDAVLDGQALEAELALKREELANLTPPEREISEIDASLQEANADLKEASAPVEELEQTLVDAGGSDATIEEQLEGARADELAALDELDELNADKDAAIEYEMAADVVKELEAELEDQPELERSALEAAANKPVDDRVETAVKLLLALE